MYNRYIPQPDGSYRRSHQPEPQQPRRPQNQQRPQQQKPQACPPPEKPAPCPAPQEPCAPEEPRPHRSEPRRPACQGQSVTSFLRQLLPKDFDTADLLIVLLLLLMAGDSQEDQNNAMLTLVLYLFM